MFDWNDLKLFVAVAQTGSSQAAARETGLSQPTISRRLSALEYQLKVPLFTRDTTGFQLTPNGRKLLTYAEDLNIGMAEFEEQAGRLQRSLSGKIKVSASHAFAGVVLSPIIAKFRAQHPDIEIEIISTNKFLDIRNEGVDLALRVGRRPDDPRLIARKVANFGWGVYCGRSYADRVGRPACAAQIHEHELVSFSGFFQKNPLIPWFELQSKGKPPLARYDSLFAIQGALKVTDAVGLLLRVLADRDPDLVHCFDAPDELRQEAWLVTTATARALTHVQAFVEFALPRIAACAAHPGRNQE